MVRRRRDSQSRLQFRMRTACAWCGKYVTEDTPVYSRGGKLQPGVDLSAYAGQVITMRLASHRKTLLLAITGLGSEARREGYDYIFMICSHECGDELAEALRQERKLLEAILPG